MKKIISITAIIIVALSLINLVLATDELTAKLAPYKILVNKQEKSFNNPIVTINDVTYLPLREFVESLKMDVNWSEENQAITIDKKESKPEISTLTRIGSKMNIALPQNSKIIHYDEHGEYYFYTKVMINKDDLNFINSQLDAYFIKPFDKLPNYVPNFINVCTWWDLEQKDVDLSYHKFESGGDGGPQTIDVWAFVTKSIDNHRFLYIGY